jgi:chemotaxis signal transduction protein
MLNTTLKKSDRKNARCVILCNIDHTYFGIPVDQAEKVVQIDINQCQTYGESDVDEQHNLKVTHLHKIEESTILLLDLSRSHYIKKEAA